VHVARIPCQKAYFWHLPLSFPSHPNKPSTTTLFPTPNRRAPRKASFLRFSLSLHLTPQPTPHDNHIHIHMPIVPFPFLSIHRFLPESDGETDTLADLNRIMVLLLSSSSLLLFINLIVLFVYFICLFIYFQTTVIIPHQHEHIDTETEQRSLRDW